jgi:hypothetical protein
MYKDSICYLLASLILISCAIMPCTADTNLTLQEGWNYIAIPYTHTNYQHTAFSLFSTVNTMGHSILRYNSQTQLWEALSQQSVVTPLEGVWVYSGQPVSIPVAGDNTERPAPKHLPAGWNAIGFAGSATNPGDAFSSLSDHWVLAMGWNSEHQQYDPSVFTGDVPGTQVIIPGKGYWIYLGSPGNYTINQQLEPVPPSGNLTVSSYPIGSLVYIDGVNTGVVTFAQFTNITQGSHNIRLTSDGFPDYATTVVINANQTTSLFASLSGA